jgi:hypothetical protein
MRFLKRLVSMNFWYELSQNLTIWGTLRKIPDLNSIDIKKIKQEYKFLRKDNQIFIDDIQSEYHVSWCSIILAIYRVCTEKGIDKKRSMEITEMAVFSIMKADSISKYIENTRDKSNDTFKYMVNASKNQEKFFFGKTFIFDRKKDDSKSYHVHVSRCLYFDLFNKNHVTELMEIACKWDMISWSCGIKPQKHKIVFERPFTLGLDGRNCEFNFDKIE